MSSKKKETAISSSMFHELAARNVRKSAKTYFIYFFTLMLSVCLFYSFNSVSTQFEALGLEDKLNYLAFSSGVLTVFSIVVCIIMGALVVYANRFLLKRRKKEMGIYATLGMERTDLNRLLMKETWRIGMVSLVAGLALGVFAAQVLSLITAKLAGLSLDSYHFMVSFKAIILSILFFGILFFFVHRLNVKELKKMSLLDMLYADRKNESMSETKPITQILTAVLAGALILGGYAMIFFMADESIYRALGLGGLLLIFGTILFFSSVYQVMARLMKKKASVYYRGLTMFTAAQFTSRLKTEGRSKAMVSILLFLSLSLTILGPGMGKYLMNGIENADPFDGTIHYAPWGEEKTFNNPMEELRNAGFEIHKLTDAYSSFWVYEAPFLTTDFLTASRTHNRDKKTGTDKSGESSQLTVIGAEDYNHMLVLQGKKPILLGSDEFAISYAFPSMEGTVKDFAKNPRSLTLDGRKLSLAEHGIYCHAWQNRNVLLDQGTMVVPQSLTKGLTPTGWVLDFNFSGDSKEGNHQLYDQWFEARTDRFQLMAAQEVIISITADQLLTTYLGIYLGITFLITAGAVLALQQLTQSADNVKRYCVLRRLGASKEDMRQTLAKQLTVHFGVPILVAMLHSAVVIVLVFRYFEGLAISTMAVIIGFGLLLIWTVYLGYFITTYIGSRRILQL